MADEAASQAPSTESLAAQYEMGDEAAEPTFAAPPPLSGVSPEPDQSSPVPAPEPTRHQHPSYLAKMAESHGISREEMDSMPTDFLGEMVDRLHRQQQRLSQEFATAKQLGQPRQQPAAAPPPVLEEEAIDLGINEEDYAPEFVTAMKKVASHGNKKLKALEEKLQQYEQRDLARQQETFNQMVDRRFNEDASLAKVFGKGTIGEIKSSNQKAAARRLEVVKLVDALRMGGDQRSFDEIFDEAKAFKLSSWKVTPSMDGVIPPAPAPEVPALTQQQKDWLAASTQKPTSRVAGQEPPGVKKARSSVAKALETISAAANTDGSPESNGHASLEDFLE